MIFLILRDIIIGVEDTTEANHNAKFDSNLPDPCETGNDKKWIALVVKFKESMGNGFNVTIGNGSKDECNNCKIINKELDPNKIYAIHFWIKSTFANLTRFSKYTLTPVSTTEHKNNLLYVFILGILIGLVILVTYYKR